MGKQFSYWGDGLPILVPDKSTGGMDYWGDGEAAPVTALVASQTLSPSGITTAEAFGTANINNTIGAVGGIASGEAFGTLALLSSQTLSPSTIDTAEAFGSPNVGRQTLSPSGITTAEAFGNLKIDLELSPIGIVSEEAVSTPKINPVIQPTAIGSEEAFGEAWLSANLTLKPSAIDTEEAFGMALVRQNPVINLNAPSDGILSAEAVGQPRIRPGPVTITATAIASLEAVGAVLVWPGPVTIRLDNWYLPTMIEARNEIQRYLYVTSRSKSLMTSMVAPLYLLASGSGVYPMTNEWLAYNYLQYAIVYANLPYIISLSSLINAIYYAVNFITGIASQESMGQPILRHCITPSAITSQETFGQTVIQPGPAEIDLDDNGIDSLQGVGLPLVQPGPSYVYPVGIISTEAFGVPIILPQIRPEAIASEEAIGEPTLSCGPVDILPAAIDTPEDVGMPLLGLNIFRLIGVESGEAFGDLTIEPGPVDVLPAAIDSQEEFGVPRLNFGIFAAGDIDSEETIGVPQLNQTEFLVGVISKARVGTPRVRPGPVSIFQRSIPSEGMVGQARVKCKERADLIYLDFRSQGAVDLEAGQGEIELYFKEAANG